MDDRYMVLDGIEMVNAARTKAYAKKFLTTLEVPLDVGTLAAGLGNPTYVSPAADAAPWYVASRAESGNFYGFLPVGVQGASDSTRGIKLTQLNSSGAVASMARFGSKEIRVKLVALALNDAAMEWGITWLKETLDAACVSNGGLGCLDRQLQMFSAVPATVLEAADRLRTFYKVQPIDAPSISKVHAARGASVVEIEFILTTSPWAFTSPVRTGVLTMDTTPTTQTDAAGEDCYGAADPTAGFINDPYFTAIAKPPSAPVIGPPNLPANSSWKRKTLAIPTAETARAGRVVPVLTVAVGSNDLQQLRLRFYKTGTLTGCGFDGEFLVSYLPVNSTMVIDGIRKEIRVTVGGKTTSGSHLVYGSGGAPFSWPSFSCHTGITLTADMLAGNTGLTVTLDTAIRE